MKQLYFAPPIILSIFVSHIVFAGPPIETIIQLVLKAKSTDRINTLIDTAKKPYLMSNSEKINPQKLNQLKKTAPILTEAIINLHSIPGFEPTLHIALTSLGQSNCIGYIYEIKKAAKITQANIDKKCSEEVLSMNTTIKMPGDLYGTTFDIITTSEYIECKAINWDHFTPKLRNQFLRQQQVMAFLNKINDTSFQYTVHTSTEISTTRLQWFEKHGISVVVDKKD